MELIRKYEERAIRSGQELLLQFGDAEQFVEDCRRAGVVVLRMDFYRHEGASITPSLLYADLFEYAVVDGGAELAAAAALAILRSKMPSGETLVSFDVAMPERKTQ